MKQSDNPTDIFNSVDTDEDILMIKVRTKREKSLKVWDLIY